MLGGRALTCSDEHVADVGGTCATLDTNSFRPSFSCLQGEAWTWQKQEAQDRAAAEVAGAAAAAARAAEAQAAAAASKAAAELLKEEEQAARTAVQVKQKSAAKKARQKQQKQVRCHHTVCLVSWPGSM